MSNAEQIIIVFQTAWSICSVSAQPYILTIHERDSTNAVSSDRAARIPSIPPDVVSNHQRDEGIPFNKQKSSTESNDHTTWRFEILKQLRPNHLLTQQGKESSQHQRIEPIPSKRRTSPTLQKDMNTQCGNISDETWAYHSIIQRFNDITRKARDITNQGYTIDEIARHVGTSDNIRIVVWKYYYGAQKDRKEQPDNILVYFISPHRQRKRTKLKKQKEFLRYQTGNAFSKLLETQNSAWRQYLLFRLLIEARRLSNTSLDQSF